MNSSGDKPSKLDETAMNESNNCPGGLRRRDLLKGIAAAGLGFAVGAHGAAQAPDDSPSPGSAAQDLIRRENAEPGTRDWMLTKTRIEPKSRWRSPWIEGYCSATSVRAGDTLRIMVSTNPASNFSLEIFRTGYYGGAGGRLAKRFDSLPGKTQPDPPIGENRLRECQWEPSVEFTIPDDWLSGVYLGKLTAEKEGLQSYVIFIVRDDRPCDLLLQCSDLTWCAYNRWPDSWSLYDDGKKFWHTGPDSGLVSLDRPYAWYCQPRIANNNLLSLGSGEYLLWEFPLAFWLEKYGYDVSYISNVDTHADGQGLMRAKGFLSVGHDEYWSLEMYDHVSRARDAGVNLAFLSANSVWGLVPLLPASDRRPHRIIRRDGNFLPADPGEELRKRLGFKMRGPDTARLIGARSTDPVVGGADWTCVKPEHWLFEGTGMKKADAVDGLIGWEFHGSPATDLPGLQVVAEGDTFSGKGHYTATMYDGPKGNVVYNAATIWWAQGLASPPGHVLPSAHGAKPKGPDPRVQRMTINLLKRFTE